MKACVQGRAFDGYRLWARHIVVSFILLTLAGCATRITKAGSPTTTPSAWSSVGQSTAQASAGDLSQWWSRFGDSTLSSLIEQALRANPNLRIAQARLHEARAQRNLAAANRLPTIGASGSISGQQAIGGPSGPQGAIVAGGSAASTGSGNLYSAVLDASWEPDVFGIKRYALKGAQADLQATQNDLYSTQVSLVAEVASNYSDLRTFQKRLRIARENEASQAQTAQITEWRAEAGLVSSVDVEQARTNLAQTGAQIPSLEASVAQAQHRLGILLGLSPGALKEQLAVSAPNLPVPDQVAVGIPAEILRQRPDVKAAEQRIIAETARLAKARAARYPSFSLTGSIGAELITGALSSGTSIGTWAGSAAQTIFDGGRIRQQINIQSAVQERAVATYESTVLTALEDVENALVSFEKNRQRLAALNTARGAAHNAASLARNRYSAGLTDFQTVLDTERTVLSIEDSIATTEGDRITALIKLYKAMGGGWSSTTVTTNSQTQGNHS